MFMGMCAVHSSNAHVKLKLEENIKDFVNNLESFLCLCNMMGRTMNHRKQNKKCSKINQTSILNRGLISSIH